MLKYEDWRVSKMSENGLGMECDLHLFYTLSQIVYVCWPKREYLKELSIIVTTDP